MACIAFWLSFCVAWITFSRSAQQEHQKGARITIKHTSMQFPSFTLPNSQNNTVLRLVKVPDGADIYAATRQSLYVIKGDSGHRALDTVPLPKTTCQDGSSDCQYISLLTEGTDGNPLFICTESDQDKRCYDVNSERNLVDRLSMQNTPHINEPSFRTGKALFFTISGVNSEHAALGLYKQTESNYIWPVLTNKEQRYVKIIADKGSSSLESKLYTLYIEKNTNTDPETPLWIPRVSQICMADEGGIKNKLQFRWTSMLTSRLFCGDEKKRISFTELLDVAVLEAEEWSNTMVYALFKNDYNLSAICVYKMANISRTFMSSRFVKNDKVPEFPRPGECVSEKNINFLAFMQSQPEMVDWIKPVHGPLLISHQDQYTHLQVDRVEGRENILLLALESGRIHKVLEQDGETFIIAEYQPFASKTRVQNMVLNNQTKQLYVSTNSEVVLVDLKNCTMYGSQCYLCVLARDPYCGWSKASSACLPADQYSIQDLSGSYRVCGEEPHKVFLKQDKPSDVTQIKFITPGTTYHLNCPMISTQATYVWLHGEGERDRRRCIFTEQGCLLLVDSMSEEDQGTYRCIASENGKQTVVVRQELRVNGAPWLRATPLVLACLLLLISVIS